MQEEQQKKNAIQNQILKRSASAMGQMEEEMELRASRLKRFNERAEQEAKRRKSAQISANKAREAFLKAGAEGNPDVIDWDEDTVIGTCKKLEKSYLRITSAVDPSTVRPLPILQKALVFLVEKWKKEGNYTYICDQLKSLRQDLTVQRIKNEFTVKVYETHARIAIEKVNWLHIIYQILIKIYISIIFNRATWENSISVKDNSRTCITHISYPAVWMNSWVTAYFTWFIPTIEQVGGVCSVLLH